MTRRPGGLRLWTPGADGGTWSRPTDPPTVYPGHVLLGVRGAPTLICGSNHARPPDLAQRWRPTPDTLTYRTGSTDLGWALA